MKRSLEITSWSTLAALTVGAVGCTVTADPPLVASPMVVVDSTPGVVYADYGAAPLEVDIATYPQTYYGGHAFYLYRDQWYYQDGGRWAYYRQEPPELYRQRSYAQQAPPAARRVEQAPPAERREERAQPAERREEHAQPAERHEERARPPERPAAAPTARRPVQQAPQPRRPAPPRRVVR